MRQVFTTWKVLLLILLFLPGISAAQQTTITGSVTDRSTGETLPGVYVVVKGTNTGTVTDADGRYSLSVPDGATLVFSFLGYQAQEIQVGNSREINVSLEVTMTEFDEVVVIGYGTVRKADATGSVSVVTSDDFNRGAITSPQELITGKVAGVVITPGSGAPGSASTIRIRGGSSMSASNDPLIVIDGVPMDQNTPWGMNNSLNLINPNDIETVNVLKDASATAIYGSRASNGVILITTKKGTDKFSINYNGTLSANTVPKTLEVLSADEYRNLVIDLYGPSSNAAGRLGTANTDWQKEIYRTALSTDHTLSVGGKVASVPYRASVGYTNDNGILKTSNFSRYTLALGASPSMLDDHLRLNINLKGMGTDTRWASEAAIGAALNFDPTQPIYDNSNPSGYFYWKDNDGNPINIAVSNPVARLNLTNDQANVWRSVGNLQGDYKFHFMPDLHANFNIGYDYSRSDGSLIETEDASWTFDPENGSGTSRNYSQERYSTLFNFYLNYNKELPSIYSRVDATAGYENQYFRSEAESVEYNFAETYEKQPLNRDKSHNLLISWFGRLNYSLLDRYLLTFTVRRDGSSRFHPDNQIGWFPSVALAWKIKSEQFLSNVNFLSELKLRLGYGITGQQAVTRDFPYLAIYTLSDNLARYQLGDQFYNTLRPEGYDEKIKWEETTTYNVGLDIGLFENRIVAEIDVYNRETNDLLNSIPVPAGSNLTNRIVTNVGNLTNKGIEVNLKGNVISRQNTSWEIGLNLGYNKNEITRLTRTDDPNFKGVRTGNISGGVGSTIQIYSVGYPLNSFLVYQQVYDENDRPVEGLYVDRDGDGVVNEDDLYNYQKAAPDYQLGITSTLNFKNWDFTFSGRANIGNYVYNNVMSTSGTYLDVYNPGLNYLSNALADASKTGFRSAQYFSDYYVENASFFRMDNIGLGYRFANVMKTKMILRIAANVQNAFIITKYSGLDPEVFNGIDNNLYPRPRVFVLGVNLDF